MRGLHHLRRNFFLEQQPATSCESHLIDANCKEKRRSKVVPKIVRFDCCKNVDVKEKNRRRSHLPSRLLLLLRDRYSIYF